MIAPLQLVVKQIVVKTKRQMKRDREVLQVTANCPGKVLVAGGYTILERPNKGLVLSTSARFHTKIGHEFRSEDFLKVHIVSPQYQQKLELKVDKDMGMQHVAGDRNPYVERTVAYGIATAVYLEEELRFGNGLLEILTNQDDCLDSMDFQEIMGRLNFHFQFANMKFAVGEVSNEAASNQNSLKLLLVAKKLGLEDDITKRLWGEHYRHVAADPDGTSHGNLRAFLKGGVACVTFDDEANGIVGASPAAQKFLQDGLTKTGESQQREKLVQELGGEMTVELLADNDFYSQQAHLKERGLPYNTESLKTLHQFLPCKSDGEDNQVAKTGLGSSAAMVTSVVGAIMKVLTPSIPDLTKEPYIGVLHTYAQYIHNVIQGKIGSGFDVCAAVYGSMKYVRYDAGLLSDALAMADKKDPARPNYIMPPDRTILLACMHKLNHQVEPFELPPRLQLICGDVCGGSETPSMSRNILKWKNDAPPEELQNWLDLIANNDKVGDCFHRLSKLAKEDTKAYNEAVDACCEFSTEKDWEETAAKSQNPTLVELANLRSTFSKVRHYLRTVGELAQVPVEPSVQTTTCDKAMAQPGVVVCGVPGAGGFDAIFAVVVDNKRASLEQFWANEKDAQICALLLEESRLHPGIQISLT